MSEMKTTTNSRIYKQLRKLYLARKFLLASYAFGKVITKYPAFHLVDLAAFYKGKSFEIDKKIVIRKIRV